VTARRFPLLLPAIDIRGGRAVRLLEGDFSRETAYDDNPADAAARWASQGAELIHVVDLDGAREGRPAHLDDVRRIAERIEVPIQVGGGLRDLVAVEDVLAAGAARAVLGTAAQRDPALVEELIGRHGSERIVAAVDSRGGRVAVEGWERETATSVIDLIETLLAHGVRRFLYTPVEVDGGLGGPGLEGLDGIAAACERGGAELIYSGGIGSLDDLSGLAALGLPALAGVVVGRALYERRFDVGEGIAALAGGESE
jgi:phosphoribosylformimino-5-aminoimidazole carboxamide ribotide isomerase